MFSTTILEQIWQTARNVDAVFPITYDNLLGAERLAVLLLLQEPLQSTLHQIIQQKVDVGTHCVYNGCPGILNRTGQCSKKCEQSGVNVVCDIMECDNCDSMGFPCTNCHRNIFRKQIKTDVGDY